MSVQNEASVTRRSWIIAVCKTCDRLAVWPFCEHRPKAWQDNDGRWYENVRVSEGRR